MLLKKEIGVIGLGKFGFCLAETLSQLGSRVIGVDMADARIKIAQEVLAQVYSADATDKAALKQLGFHDLPHVVVSIGDSMESSILITMNLKELGVPKVWVKALSLPHEKILYRLGADYVVFPERFVARQLAHKLAVPGLLNYLTLGDGIVLQEITVDKWAGKPLYELDLPNKHHIQVVAVKRSGEREFSFVPRADTVFEKGDLVVVIGDKEHMGER